VKRMRWTHVVNRRGWDYSRVLGPVGVWAVGSEGASRFVLKNVQQLYHHLAPVGVDRLPSGFSDFPFESSSYV
jgi:hypothetical protein